MDKKAARNATVAQRTAGRASMSGEKAGERTRLEKNEGRERAAKAKAKERVRCKVEARYNGEIDTHVRNIPPNCCLEL